MKRLFVALFAALSLYAQTSGLPSCTTPTQTNCQAPGLDQGVLSSAQVPTAPNHASPFASLIPASVQLTDDIYWASKPAAEQALRTTSSTAPRTGTANTFMPPSPTLILSEAMQLAQNGYQIDYWIEALANDPVVTMLMRQEMGIIYVPSIGGPSQPTLIADGPNVFASPFAGSIHVSLNPSDYPPFYPPAPAAAAATVSISEVGNFEYDDGTSRWFGAGPGALAALAAGTLKSGQTYTEGGQTYTIHLSMGLMGQAISFSLPD